MSVDELGLLHNRYIDLSNRFRAAWTYQQFLAGLHKMVPDQGLEVNPAEFQVVHNRLREVSLALNASETESVARQLAALEDQIAAIVTTLRDRDEMVSPSLLRQFFQRVRKCDNKILLQMVKFFVYTQSGAEWGRDRLDKVDFLLTKASEQPDSRTGLLVLDRGRMMAVAQGLWHILGARKTPAEEIQDRCGLIQDIQLEANSIESFEHLDELNLVGRYRQLKASFGSDIFEPATLMAVLEANLNLKNRVNQLYRREEAQIVAEYQQIFDLHRDTQVDTELEEDLANFQLDIENFERKLQKDEIRLEELANIRNEARRLKPRLGADEEPAPARASTAGGAPVPAVGPDDVANYEPSSDPSESSSLEREIYSRLVAALGDSDMQASVRSVTLTPEVFPFQLEPREVVAYRRLSSSSPCDRDHERFILEGASMRVLSTEVIHAIASILDDSGMTKDSPVFKKARLVCDRADTVLRRFAHLIEAAVLARQSEDAGDLQLLRMRLLREYSELWLLANKPS